MSELEKAQFGLIVSDEIPLRQFNQEQAEAFHAGLVDVVNPYTGRNIDRTLIDELAQKIGMHLKSSFTMVPRVAIRAGIGEPGELMVEILFLPEPDSSDS